MSDEFTKVKNVELEILEQFMKICDVLQLRWYAGYGTVLGAVRHKGFIPWDDDVDVVMPRKDYEIFCEKAKELLPENMFLQTMETEEEYYQPFAKLRRSDTTFWEIGTQHDHINHGIYMDIFPLDGYPTKKIDELIFKFKRVVYDNFLYQNGNIGELGGYRKVFATFYRIFKGKLSKKEAAKRKEMLAKRIPYDTAELVSCLVEDTPKAEAVLQAVYGDGEKALFEYLLIRIPKQSDLYLKKLYGDYMQFPPEDQRIPLHTCTIIDAEKSYLEYLQYF